MDVKPAGGRRQHFRQIAGTTPILVVGEGPKHAVVFISDVDMVIGTSGSLASLGMYLPADTGFADNYSTDEWWAKTASGSGTISGFVVS